MEGNHVVTSMQVIYTVHETFQILSLSIAMSEGSGISRLLKLGGPIVSHSQIFLMHAETAHQHMGSGYTQLV